jgi:hypothetical protein
MLACCCARAANGQTLDQLAILKTEPPATQPERRLSTIRTVVLAA